MECTYVLSIKLILNKNYLKEFVLMFYKLQVGLSVKFGGDGRIG